MPGAPPPQASEHHRHQLRCFFQNCPSICIRRTFVWQAPPPPPQRSQHQRHQLGFFFYKCRASLPPPQTSKHYRHQLGCFLSAHRQQQGCVLYKCRASSASSGLSLGRLLCEQVSEVHSTINSRLNTRSLQHNQDSRPSGSEVPVAKLKLKLCSPNLQQPCRDCREIHTMHPESTARCLCAFWCMARPKLAKKQHVNNRNRNLKTWKAEQRQGDI